MKQKKLSAHLFTSICISSNFCYEWQVFSGFCIQIMNGCILDIYFDFSHDFKTTDRSDWFKTVQAFEINVNKAKISNCSNCSTKMSLFTNLLLDNFTTLLSLLEGNFEKLSKTQKSFELQTSNLPRPPL